jgi:hypothetical protein
MKNCSTCRSFDTSAPMDGEPGSGTCRNPKAPGGCAQMLTDEGCSAHVALPANDDRRLAHSA